ncbi:hypothetical protein [Stenomitos frigidus]|nr:hypothetical protein [Stenomitos frigidus]
MFMLQQEGLTMLALLLENVGIDKAIKVGNPEVWHEAIANYQN